MRWEAAWLWRNLKVRSRNLKVMWRVNQQPMNLLENWGDVWRGGSSGEALGRFSVGERFHRLLLRPYLLIVGPSWICLLPRLESVRSQDGFTAGTSVHRGKGGCHQHWIWLRGLHGNKEAIVEQGGGFLGKDRMRTYSPHGCVFVLKWEEWNRLEWNVCL